jgi:N4-gp56 family major capsid protein
LTGDGVAGDRTLEGNEESLQSFDTIIQIDQWRNANRSEGRISDQRSIVNFRMDSRDKLAYQASDRIDQMAFLSMSGVSYAMHNNGSPRVGSDLVNLAFASDVSAPTSQRVTRWDATGQNLVVGANAVTGNVTATDYLQWATIVQLKAYAKNQYIRGVREAGGEETYHMFVTPSANARLKLDADYLDALKWAQKRGPDNPLFTGSAVKVDGIYIHEFRHVYNSSSGISGSTMWGAGNNVNGAQVLFCGAQALGMADLGIAEWTEKEFDYENQLGISVSKLFGLLKPQFNSIYSNNTVQDFGVVSCYVAQ